MEALHFDLLSQLRRVKKSEHLSVCRKIPPSHAPKKGEAEVTISDVSEDALTLFERGIWYAQDPRKEMAFTNALRFSFLKGGSKIALEHLRYGKTHPVLLFELEKIGPNLFRSFKPHVCKEDIYTGSVLFDAHFIQLSYQVMGPEKNSSFTVVYTSS